MKLQSIKLRFCRSIACDKLKGLECEVDECEHPDRLTAVRERQKKLKEVKHGGSA